MVHIHYKTNKKEGDKSQTLDVGIGYVLLHVPKSDIGNDSRAYIRASAVDGTTWGQNNYLIDSGGAVRFYTEHVFKPGANGLWITYDDLNKN